MHRSRSLALRATLLGAAVALGACGSDGGAGDGGTDVVEGDDALVADDPAGGTEGAPGGGTAGETLPPTDGAGSAPGEADGASADDAGAPGSGDEEGDENESGSDPGAQDAQTADPEAGATPPAASDPTGEIDLSGTASRLGLVLVDRAAAPEDERILAAFVGLDEPLALEDALPVVPGERDVCTFDSGGGDGGGGIPGIATLPAPGDAGATFLSAGETIVATGPGGTFATLARTALPGFVAYALDDGVDLGPIPSGLVLDVPGDAFPAFAAVRVPDAPPLANVSPAEPGAATAGTTFGWDAGADPAARVVVDLTVLGTDPEVSIACVALDDGEFRLPASILARVPADRPVAAGLSRVAVQALREGDAVLLVVATGEAAR